VSTSVHASQQSRNLVVRLGGGERLPDALVTVLKQERVTCGWVRASGVLTDVELRGYDGSRGALGNPHRIAGPLHALSLEGSVGVVEGTPSLTLRGLLAREGDAGLQAIAGEVASAQVVALEVLVSSLEDLTLERALDERAGVWLLAAPGTVSPVAARAPIKAPAAPAAPWAVALEASERAEPARMKTATMAASAATIPARPPRPELDLDAVQPEPGDIVEHFAFGRCEVMKSDGDRLHIRVQKDQRIREIALEMLKVTQLPEPAEPEGGAARRFKLERRL
jgi:predicted DNA-binding protein with PD1-like motif